MTYQFYGKRVRGNYKYIMKYDNDGKAIGYFIVLEQHLIKFDDEDTPNFKICICTDGKSREPIWFKCTYFDIDNYEITYCDNQTKSQYEDKYGDTYNRRIGDYVN